MQSGECTFTLHPNTGRVCITYIRCTKCWSETEPDRAHTLIDALGPPTQISIWFSWRSDSEVLCSIPLPCPPVLGRWYRSHTSPHTTEIHFLTFVTLGRHKMSSSGINTKCRKVSGFPRDNYAGFSASKTPRGLVAALAPAHAESKTNPFIVWCEQSICNSSLFSPTGFTPSPYLVRTSGIAVLTQKKKAKLYNLLH